LTTGSRKVYKKKSRRMNTTAISNTPLVITFNISISNLSSTNILTILVGSAPPVGGENSTETIGPQSSNTGVFDIIFFS